MATSIADTNTASLPGLFPFEAVEPCFLIATGDAERLEVLRSPLVRESDSMYEPVRRFIAQYGLALSAREKFEDDDWMFGEVEVSVYVPPASRSASYARLTA